MYAITLSRKVFMPLRTDQRGWIGRHLWNKNTPDAAEREAAQRAKLLQKCQERHEKLIKKLTSKPESLQSIIKIGITQALEKIESSPQEALETFAELEKQLTRSYSAAEQEVLTDVAQKRQTAADSLSRLVTQARRMKNLTQEMEAALQQELDQFVSVDQDFLQNMRARPLTQDRLDEEQHYFRQMNRHYKEVLEKIDALSVRLDAVAEIQLMINYALTQYHKVDEQFTPLIQGHAGTKLEPLLLLEQQNLRFALQRSAVSPLLHPDLKVLKPSRTLLSGMLMRQDQLAKRVKAALEQLKASSQALDRDRDKAELDDQWNAGRVVSFEERAHDPDNTEFDNVSDNQVLALRDRRREDMNFIAAAFDATLEKARLKENGNRPPIELDVAPHFDPTTLLKKGWGTSEQISERHLRRRIKQRMAQMLNGVDERTRRDLALDYILQGEADVRARLIEAQGWDANALSVPQENVLKSAIKVMDKTLGAYQAGTLSADGEELKVSASGTQAAQQFKKGRKLGQGGFGDVFLYMAEDGQSPSIAVKVMKARDGEQDEDNIKHAESDKSSRLIGEEIRCHHHLMRGPTDHPGRQFITELKGVVKDAEGNLNMAMELLDGGDFKQNRLGMELASQAGAIPQAVLQVLHSHQLKQAIQGMMYLRDMGVVHHDLKPENFFMKADGTLKIGDFGSGTIQLSDDNTFSGNQAGTDGYKVSSAELDSPSPDKDAFALGRILDIIEHQHVGPEKEMISSHSSGTLHPLLQALTEKYSTLRPTLEQVLEAPYFQNASTASPEDIAKLQQLSCQFSQQLAASIRPHKQQLITELKSLLTPDQFKEIGDDDSNYVELLKRGLVVFEEELRLCHSLQEKISTLEGDDYQNELMRLLDSETYNPVRKGLRLLLEKAEKERQAQEPPPQEQELEQAGEPQLDGENKNASPKKTLNLAEAFAKTNPQEALQKLHEEVLFIREQLREKQQDLLKLPELAGLNEQLKEVSARIQQAGVVA